MLKKEKNLNNKLIIAITICVTVLGLLLFFQFSILEVNTEKSNIKKSIDTYFVNHTTLGGQHEFFDHYYTEKDISRYDPGQSFEPLDGIGLKIVKQGWGFYDQFKPNENTIVIYPTFTSAAYSDPGFYTFFNGKCDESCLTVNFENPELKYTSSGMTTQVMEYLGYDFITDVDVDKNPEILENYETLIILHNEYVTQKEFDAISTHPNIIFLYPNALFAEIEVDYTNSTITLIRGHQYPNFPNGPGNSFDYEIEKRFHEFEFDQECLDWEFVEIENGYHLNCYPDHAIPSNLDILLAMKDL